jgi:hypothetical protein
MVTAILGGGSRGVAGDAIAGDAIAGAAPS